MIVLFLLISPVLIQLVNLHSHVPLLSQIKGLEKQKRPEVNLPYARMGNMTNLSHFLLISLPPAVFEIKNASHLNIPWFYTPFTRGIGVSMSETWCWHDHHSDNISFLVLPEWDWLASVLGYMHKAIWLADAFGAWKFILPQATQGEAMRRTHNSVRCEWGVTGFPVNPQTTWLWKYEDLYIPKWKHTLFPITDLLPYRPHWSLLYPADARASNGHLVWDDL